MNLEFSAKGFLCGAVVAAAAAAAGGGLDLQREIDAAAEMGGGVVRVDWNGETPQLRW